jgi:uncharacterized protein YciI
MKYMLIHTIDPNAEHRTEGMPTHDAWLDEMLARGVNLHGDRLRDVSDGPFAETKEQIAGYDVIECTDLDEAIEVAAKHPTAWLGTIEVRPIQDDPCGGP